MTRRMLVVAVMGVAMVATAQQAAAFGKKRGGAPCEPCGAPAPCATAAAAPCGPQYTVSYVDQKVTAYKQEAKTRDVKVTVNEWVDVKEDYKYFTAKPVVTKQKVTVNEMQTKQEAYKYQAMEWTTVKEKVKVCEYKQVERVVDVVSYDMVPVQTVVKKTVCETVCVPVTVTKVVYPKPERKGLFARCCKKDDCADPCPPCPQYVTCTVMQKQTVTRVIDVPCTTYNRVEKKSQQKVMTSEPVWAEKEMDVRKCVPVEKTGTRTVCYTVPVEKTVDVTTYQQVEQTGTRMVKKCVPTEKVVKQTYYEAVPYETTVKVPVYTPAPTPAPAPCATPCDTAPVAATACCGSGGGRTRGRLLGGCCGR